MGGIGKNLGFKVLKCGGTKDHVHLLISIPARLSAATVVQKLKANSSRFLGETFAWQEGYGVFAVSASQLHVVKAYIAGQEEHHRKQTFEEEFGALIRRYGLCRENGRVVDVVR